MNSIKFKNFPYIDHKSPHIQKLSYPRLQVNKLGEIVLVTDKQGGLSRGVLVAKTAESKSLCHLGFTISDWEVAGPLEDYCGEVNASLRNNYLPNGDIKNHEH